MWGTRDMTGDRETWVRFLISFISLTFYIRNTESFRLFRAREHIHRSCRTVPRNQAPDIPRTYHSHFLPTHVPHSLLTSSSFPFCPSCRPSPSCLSCRAWPRTGAKSPATSSAPRSLLESQPRSARAPPAPFPAARAPPLHAPSSRPPPSRTAQCSRAA